MRGFRLSFVTLAQKGVTKDRSAKWNNGFRLPPIGAVARLDRGAVRPWPGVSTCSIDLAWRRVATQGRAGSLSQKKKKKKISCDVFMMQAV